MSDEREYIAIRIKLPQPPEIRLADALLEACEANDLEVAQKLVKLGAKVNTQGFSICGNEERTDPVPLHHAVRHNNYDLINLLLEAGADVNLEADGGIKPLHEVRWAQLRKEPPWLRKIVQATKDINKPDQQGFTVLHYAAKYAAPQFVEMLLNHGASVNESSQEYHVLCEVFQSKNPTIFRLIWNHSDKQLFKSLKNPEYYILIMLNFGWYKPDKVACLYDVLKVLDKFTRNSRFLFIIAMAEFGYDCSNDNDEDAERKLMQTKWPTFELGDPEFLKINLCEVIRRLHAHGADLSTIENKIAIVYFCYKYNISKSTQRQYELLDTIAELDIDLKDIFPFAAVNYPKFTLLLLKYSNYFINELLALAALTKRCDVAFLNYITTLLMICSPPRYYRVVCFMNITQMIDKVAIHRFNTYTEEDYYKPLFLCINKSEFDDPYVKAERFVLLNKVTRLLKIDRMPTLQELARNCIRLCLKDKTSKEFLQAVDSLNMPEYITDIIQCRAPVCFFQEKDLEGMKAPVFPFSDFRYQSNATYSDSLPHNSQTFQHERDLSPLLTYCSNREEEQLLAEDINCRDLENQEQSTTNCDKECKKLLYRILCISIIIIGGYYLVNYVIS